MSEGKNTLFTIGQFAALHGINKKTLMWYDEIGLFQPAVISEENGYRYYNYYQSSVLETILMLRDMKVPLADIKSFIKNRSAESMEILLKERIKELNTAIASMKAVRAKLYSRHDDMAALLELDLSEISIIEKEPKYLAIVKIAANTPLETQIEMVVSEIKKHQLPRMYQASYGSMLPVETLYARHFDDYAGLFIEVPDITNKKGLHKQPGGTYLRGFSAGSWEKLPSRYEEILQYARRNHLRLYGHAYEIGINEMVIDKIDDYITKIDIPVASEGV